MIFNTNNKIAILGFGIEGRSAAQYLEKQGAIDITICDENKNLEGKPEKHKYILGADYLNNLENFDVIIRSPGVPLKTPQIQKAIESGKTVTSVTRIFFSECPCPVIAVTGTKGKGTTSTLIYEMLKKEGRDAYLGGNIGNSPLEFLEELTGDSVVILELGHGQIEDLDKGPYIGITLGVTSDHLDYHETVEEYRAAKHPLTTSQKESDIAIINSDYEGNQPFLELGKSQKYKVSIKEDLGKGACLKEETLYINNEPTIKADELALPGRHNIENALPAALAAHLMGVEKENIIEVLKTFKGLPHRIETVAEKNGITFVNDSFATTPETGIAGVRAFDTPLILLAGGSEKNSTFTQWAQEISKHPSIKQALLIGETTATRMKQELKKTDFDKITETATYEEAFEKLKTLAEPGDTVLMSPACASFDLFENYKKRGERFKELAQNY